MDRTILTRALVAFALAGTGACSQVTSDFSCLTDADCTDADGTLGRCEVDQRCSYADTSCTSGYRYGDLAGQESNACTGDTGGPGTGSGSGITSECVVSEVRSGVRDTCVRRTDGTVWCFGAGMAASQVDLPAGTIAQVGDAAGGRCGRYTDGSLDCTIGPVTGKIPVMIRELSIGTTHTCAITDGHIACWGTNVLGELGIGSTDPSDLTPQLVIAVSEAVSVSAGLASTCEVESDGELWCWGDNSRNQLGQTIIPIANAISPVEVFVPDGAATVVVGDKFACSLSSAGNVYCWGDETKAQTGQGAVGDSTADTLQVPGLAGIASITASGSHACALATDGRADCWGAIVSHLSGACDDAGVTSPALVVDHHYVSLHFLVLDAGPHHTRGRLAPNGGVVCWGDNADGEIGDGTTTPAAFPTPSQQGCP